MRAFNRDIGKYGEDLAIKFLEKKGYKLLNRNFYTKQGEIDIILSKDDTIIFVEVKTRYTKNYGNAFDAVTLTKRKKIISVSKYYLLINNIYNKFIRYDVIEVYLNNFDNKYKINHLENAFICN